VTTTLKAVLASCKYSH